MPRTREWMRACRAARRNRYAGDFCLPRGAHLSDVRRGETPARNWRCAGEWRGRRFMDRLSRSAACLSGADARVAVVNGELACRGAAMAASPNPTAKSETTPPRPFDCAEALEVLLCARRLAFREPAAVHARAFAGRQRRRHARINLECHSRCGGRVQCLVVSY